MHHQGALAGEVGFLARFRVEAGDFVQRMAEEFLIPPRRLHFGLGPDARPGRVLPNLVGVAGFFQPGAQTPEEI